MVDHQRNFEHYIHACYERELDILEVFHELVASHVLYSLEVFHELIAIYVLYSLEVFHELIACHVLYSLEVFHELIASHVLYSLEVFHEPLPHPGTRPPVLWTGRTQVWTGIPVQQLVVDW